MRRAIELDIGIAALDACRTAHQTTGATWMDAPWKNARTLSSDRMVAWLRQHGVVVYMSAIGTEGSVRLAWDKAGSVSPTTDVASFPHHTLGGGAYDDGM